MRQSIAADSITRSPREAAGDDEPGRIGEPCLDLAARRGDDMLDDREAEPRSAARARLVGAIEALEQARDVGGGHALAVVGDREERAALVRGELDGARPAGACIANRVRDQV